MPPIFPTPAAISLRPASATEFWAVARLFAALHAFNAGLDPRFRLADSWEPLLRAHFDRTHQAPGALWLLAWCSDSAVGSGQAEPVGLLLVEAHTDSPLFADRRWAELVALYVAPSQRGGDLGRTLVEAGTRWAIAHGFDRLQLYLTATNTHAKRFYARCGFAPVQEIWRAELTHAPGATPPPDPSYEADGHAAHQIELGHHHLAMELSACPDEEPPMVDLFSPQPRPDPAQLAAIKRWVVAALALPDDVTVMVTELRCSEPGCPPLETVIAVLRPGIPPEQRKLHKATSAITPDDISGLYTST